MATVTVGRIVHYRLNQQNADDIHRKQTQLAPSHQPNVGNQHQKGQIVPLLITKVHSGTVVNGQAFVDGDHSLWLTSVQEGTAEGHWFWPDQVAQEPKAVKKEEPQNG